MKKRMKSNAWMALVCAACWFEGSQERIWGGENPWPNGCGECNTSFSIKPRGDGSDSAPGYGPCSIEITCVSNSTHDVESHYINMQTFGDPVQHMSSAGIHSGDKVTVRWDARSTNMAIGRPVSVDAMDFAYMRWYRWYYDDDNVKHYPDVTIQKPGTMNGYGKSIVFTPTGGPCCIEGTPTFDVQSSGLGFSPCSGFGGVGYPPHYPLPRFPRAGFSGASGEGSSPIVPLSSIALGVTNKGTTYTVRSKGSITDESWTTITNVVATTNNTDADGNMTLALPSIPATNIFLRVETTNACGILLGSCTVLIPAGKTRLIGNPLAADIEGSHQYIGQALTNAPTGSSYATFNGTNWTTNVFDGTSWTDEGQVLDMGMAGFFANPGSNDLYLTFKGIVFDWHATGLEDFTLIVPAGTNICSYPLPKAGTLQALGFPGVAGDKVYVDSGTNTVLEYVYTNILTIVTNYGWTDPLMTIWGTNVATNFASFWRASSSGALSSDGPYLGVGAGLMSNLQTDKMWNFFQAPKFPTLDGPYDWGQTNYMHDWPMPKHLTMSGTNNCLLARVYPGYTFNLQAITDIRSTNWVTVGSCTGDNSGVVAIPVLTTNSTAMYFRLKQP